MAIFHSLEFDGVNSLDNGIFITGEAVYNSPERDVEMIEIAGRNGAFALDKGRYKNAPVSYPAGAFGNDHSDFANKIRAFRNLIASKSGYKRLVDDYYPAEYRMAVFKDAIEVDPKSGKAGEFELIFDCMPQRFLMSGESAISVADGDTVFNPTPYDARPMLELYGYGDLQINGETISLRSAYLGNIQVASSTTESELVASLEFDDTNINTGDTISFDGNASYLYIGYSKTQSGYTQYKLSSVSQTNVYTYDQVVGTIQYIQIYPDLSAGFVYGTSGTITAQLSGTASWYTNGSHSNTMTVDISVAYDGNHTITITSTITNGYPTASFPRNVVSCISKIWANSTKSALGNPVYIDLDIGEAWNEDSGSPVSVNNAVTLPANLPVLKSGNNLITYDNTFTQVDIIPRWFII